MRGKLRTSLFLKTAIIAVVVLVLAVPLVLERGVIQERRARRDQVASGVASAWGGDQVVGGPVLVVPFRSRAAIAYFLPQQWRSPGSWCRSGASGASSR